MRSTLRLALASRPLLLGGLLSLLLVGARLARAGDDICSEPNDQPAQACAVAPDASLSGYLDTTDDVDRYRLRIEQDATIQAALTDLPGDYRLRLEEDTGAVVIEADGSGQEDRALEALEMPPGVYFLVVESSGQAASADEPYTLHLSVEAAIAQLATGEAPEAVPQSDQDAAPAAKITLEGKWLVLRSEDVGPSMVQIAMRTVDEGRAVLSEVTFEPNYKGLDGPPTTPLRIVDKLWLARDVDTARQIFREQAEAGFAEARAGVSNVGGISLPSLGDDVRGIGGCGPCDSDVVHYRIVLRYLNGVHAIYGYGQKDYASQDIMTNLGRILDERIKAVPSGPLPDQAWQVNPREVVLTAGEMAKEAFTAGEQGGSDERGSWYWTRFKLPPEFERRHVGPLDIYSKVWVAPNLEVAKEIFAEQAQPGFPEAEQRVGVGQFAMENPPSVGNDNFGWSACNDDCMTARTDKLHHRYLFRSGNVLGLIYIWGGDQDASVDQVRVYAQAMRGRLK